MEKKPNRNARGIVYALLIFIVATMLCIAAVTTLNTADKKTENTPVEDSTESSQTTTDTKKRDTSDTEKQSTEKDSTSKDSEKDTEKSSTTTAAPYHFFTPVTGNIGKLFNIDTPVFSVTMNDYRTHSGLDIEADVGTGVSAFAEGTVSDIYTDPFMGHCLVITHTGGLVSKYMNLDETLAEGVEVGANVFGGQTIGRIGDSASLEAADAPHLHFEVFCDGAPVDPIDYLEYDTSMAYEDAAF